MATFSALREWLEEWGVAEGATDLRSRTRARILKAATEQFVANGYRKTSVEEVAAGAHVARATVYTHFANKAELLLHAVAEEKKRFAHHLEAVLANDVAPAVRLERYLAVCFALIGEMPLTSRLMKGDREILAVLDELGSAGETIWQRQMEFVASLLKDLPNQGELTLRANALMALLYSAGTIMDEKVRGGMDAHALAATLAAIIVRGVAK